MVHPTDASIAYPAVVRERGLVGLAAGAEGLALLGGYKREGVEGDGTWIRQ